MWELCKRRERERGEKSQKSSRRREKKRNEEVRRKRRMRSIARIERESERESARERERTGRDKLDGHAPLFEGAFLLDLLDEVLLATKKTVERKRQREELQEVCCLYEHPNESRPQISGVCKAKQRVLTRNPPQTPLRHSNQQPPPQPRTASFLPPSSKGRHRAWTGHWMTTSGGEGGAKKLAARRMPLRGATKGGGVF